MSSLFPKTHLIWFLLIASVNDGAVHACVMQDAAEVENNDWEDSAREHRAAEVQLPLPPAAFPAPFLLSSPT